MSTRQGNLKDYQNNKIAPNTGSAQVTDVDKNQALSATLRNTPDKTALGYETFVTYKAYSDGDKVYYNNKLWEFTADKSAGAWDSTKVEEYSIKELFDDFKADLLDGSIAAKLADNLSSWEGEAMSRDYVQTAYVETTGGDISIDSSLPANLKSVVPTTDFYASQH